MIEAGASVIPIPSIFCKWEMDVQNEYMKIAFMDIEATSRWICCMEDQKIISELIAGNND